MSELDPLRPRPDEIARVVGPLDAGAIESLREGLRPSLAEVARVRARVRRPAPRRLALPAAAVAVAVLIFVVLGLSRPPEIAPLAVEATLSTEAMAIGPSILTWGDARITARPRAEGAVVEMERGTAWFEVDPHGVARALEVRAGEVTVAVTGTRFAVEYGEAVTVRVERGSVRVTHPDGVVSVRAGETWTNAPAVAIVVDDAPADPPHPEKDGSAAPDYAPAGGHASPPRVKPESPPHVEADDAAAEEARTFAALLDAADRADPEVAGQIEAWLANHPASPLASEAEVLRLEALARSSPAQAERAAAAWLSANPRGSRRGDVLWLQATVARDALQDCGLALPSYRELAETGPRVAEAAALQGLCARAEGRSAEARVALRKALENGIAGPLAEPVRDALAELE